jgi:hypothetical protein
MSIYGKNTVGASWVSFENLRRGISITLGATETATKISAYVRTVGSAANGTRIALYNKSTLALAYTSDLAAGFTDTTGAWKDYGFTSSVAAGDYWLTIYAEGIAGGLNTVEIAYDAASSDTALRQSWFNDGTAWPNQSASLTGLESGSGGTEALSLYLQTSAGAAATLSAPTPSGTIGTSTTATIGATTDQATGNFYAVVDSSANLAGVTAAQIKAGQKASGTAAVAAGDVAVSTTSPSVGVSGLVASTSYAYAAIQNNANGDSNIVTGTFTTASAVSASGSSGGERARIATLMMT